MTPREHDTGVSRVRSNPNGNFWGELSDDNLTLSAAPEAPAPRPRMTPLRARPAPAGDVRILVAPRRARGDTVDHMSLAGGHSEVAERSRHRAASLFLAVFFSALSSRCFCRLREKERNACERTGGTTSKNNFMEKKKA